MERRERERILGEWGVRDDTVGGRVQRETLARELTDSPLAGRPLRRRWRNFVPEADSYVASLGGPLPYMQRLRAIHDETEEHTARLERRWRELADECGGDDAAFSRRWRRIAERWNFAAVNELIDRHNRWFPIEARLPMDPRSGDYALVGGEDYRRTPLDADWILARFPAALARAA
jgi:hypothetical protein